MFGSRPTNLILSTITVGLQLLIGAGPAVAQLPMQGAMELQLGNQQQAPSSGLGVQQALEETLLQSPRVASTRLKLGIAKAAYAQALTLPNPNFTMYNGFKAEQTYTIGAAIPIEEPWKLAFRLLLAKEQVRQADLEISQGLWTLRGEVRRTYTEMVVAQETLETLSDLAQLAGRLLDVARKRFQAGDVPELDALKARLATSQAEIELEQGKRRVIQAQQQLAIILGRPLQESEKLLVPRLPGTFNLKIQKNDLLPNFDQPIPVLDTFVADAVKHRLDLKVIDQTIKSNQASRRVAVGNILPTPIVGFGHSITGNPPNGPKLNGWNFGLNAEIPVFNWQQGDLTRYSAIIRQLRLERGATINQITAQVSAAYQRLLAARERIRVYQEHVLADSREVARLAQRSYEVGQSDITSTLAAQQANVQIRSQYLDAVLAYQQAFTDLEQAIGHPLQ
jgi:cobalt-zinc-cadmium efflux system outer membrane protein